LSWPDSLPDEHEDMIADFLDDVRDWGDAVGGQDSYRAKRDAAKGLAEHVRPLAEAGYLMSSATTPTVMAPPRCRASTGSTWGSSMPPCSGLPLS
jgi:hypothetical protein